MNTFSNISIRLILIALLTHIGPQPRAYANINGNAVDGKLCGNISVKDCIDRTLSPDASPPTPCLSDLLIANDEVRKYIVENFSTYKNWNQLGIMMTVYDLSPDHTFQEFGGLIASLPDLERLPAAGGKRAKRDFNRRDNGGWLAIQCWKHYEVLDKQKRLRNFILEHDKYIKQLVAYAVEVYAELYGLEDVETQILDALRSPEFTRWGVRAVPSIYLYGTHNLKQCVIQEFEKFLKYNVAKNNAEIVGRSLRDLSNVKIPELQTWCDEVRLLIEMENGGLGERAKKFLRSQKCPNADPGN